jgi:hypothetical protein
VSPRSEIDDRKTKLDDIHMERIVLGFFSKRAIRLAKHATVVPAR